MFLYCQICEGVLSQIANAFMVKKPEVLLSVSWQQVRYYDARSRQLVSEHSIHHISSSSQDSTDPDTFSYITNESGLIFCHVFKAPDKVKIVIVCHVTVIVH